MRLLFALLLLMSAQALRSAEFSTDSAITLIEFCKEVNSESEARFKAQLAVDLIDPQQCWAINKWSIAVHDELLAKGYQLELFIPSRYIERDKRQRLEIFVWYADKKGHKLNFNNSCELSDDAKKYILTHPQRVC